MTLNIYFITILISPYRCFAPKTHQDGAAKAEEPIGRNKIAGEDTSERKDQGAVTKELPKENCQGQETTEKEKTSRSGDTLGVGEATEPAAITRKANERQEERDQARQRDVLENRERVGNNPRREAVDAGQLMGPRPPPIPRPELGHQVTQQEWRHFLDKWTRYKAATLTPNNFPPQLIANELFNCCCQELQNDLQNVGLQVESTEKNIINKIKENAVQTVNKLRQMCEFFKMD